MSEDMDTASRIPRETAASHMVTRVPRATVGETVSHVIDTLRGQKFDCADTVFVTDTDGKLVGIVRINDLLSATVETVDEILEPRHEAVLPDDDQEAMAVLATEYDMIAVPVVDENDCFIGAVPPEALMKVLRAEHMEDLQRIAGIALRDSEAELSLTSPLADRFRRRLPWLVVGLAASSVVTFVMAGFEETLATQVTIAFFVPALVYIAGAIGTQAVSVAVRGLSAQSVGIGTLMRDELVIGSAIGVTLGAISAVAVYAFLGDAALSAAVGLAVFVGGVFSALVGFGLPWVFQRIGSDPALGSGPICTVIQDAMSLMIYFMLVRVLIG